MQETDPAAVVAAFDAAVNAGRLEEALALVSADAVAEFPGQPEPNRFSGAAEIRSWLQSDISEGIRIEASGREMNGERVTWTGRVSLATWREQGIEPIEGQGEAIVRNGRIVSFSYAVSQETLARLRQAHMS